MTATARPGTDAPVETVTITIDDVEVSVPKNTLLIRAADQIGIAIPRFCDHPLLKPAGACRQCLVEVAMPDREGNVRPMPKPQASCTMTVAPGMIVNTQRTSEVAEKAQHGVMELLLINHPLDCPVCDKGGECPLQNQAMSHGRSTSRFSEIKRTYPKPIKISTQILLDRDRCILCQRCTRFSEEIAGDAFIDLQGRGGGLPGGEEHGMVPEQIGTFDERVLGFQPEGEDDGALPHTDGPVGPNGLAGAEAAPLTVGSAQLDATGRPFASYFAGNTIQICPVGALTSSTYRFRARPFDLTSTPSVSEHDACGAAIRVDHRRGVVLRRLSGEDAAVNQEWISDKDRFAFAWQALPDRLQAPLVRDETGELVPTSWSDAIDVAARGLRKARGAGGVGVLPGGRGTIEDSYAWSKFARLALGTNDVDFRARAHTAEEAQFLGHHVAGAPIRVTYADLDRAPQVLLVGLEPEDEAATIFLRLRAAVLAGGTAVSTVAPFDSRGSTKLRATVHRCAPGAETALLHRLAGTGAASPGASTEEAMQREQDLREQLSTPGAVILVGERLGLVPGGLAAATALAGASGATLAWVPRRAGDRGAVEAGLLPGLLPGGRPVTDAAARVDVAGLWGVTQLPTEPGRDLGRIVAAAADGVLAGLLLGGVDVEDLPDPALAERAAAAAFVVSLEVRSSPLTQLADVVLPVAPPTEKSGTYLTWEGRPRPFGEVFATSARSDHQVLDMLATRLGVRLEAATAAQLRYALGEASGWDGARVPAPVSAAEPAATEEGDGVVLATWRLLLDSARCQQGEAHLAGTAYRPVARISPATAQGIGVADGDRVRVCTDRGSLELPALVTPMSERVVWLPLHSPGSSVHRTIGARAGGTVRLEPATRTEQQGRA